MLRVVLAVDCERFISFKQINPRWNGFERFKGKINDLIKNFRYNERGFEVVYDCLVKEKFPANLMIVGKLFSPAENREFIEWGYHSLNHLPLTLIRDEQLQAEIKNKFNLSSFNAPMWMIEDATNPERIFKILQDQGYKSCIYRGKNDGIKCFHYNSVEKPVMKGGIACIHVSNFFEGNWSKNRIKEIKEDILKKINSEGIYLLTTHDFTHKNPDNLLEIIKFLKELQGKGKIKVMMLKEIK